MNVVARWLPLALAGSAAVATGLPGQAPPSISAAADRSTMTVGDRLSVMVTVTHDAEEVVLWPAPSDTLGSWDVLDVQVDRPTRVAGRWESRALFALTAFELGDLEVPEIAVSVTRVGGDTTVVASRSIPVSVESVGLEGEGDIRDIKPPEEMARNWLLLAPWVLAIAALGWGGYWLYARYWRDAVGHVDIVPAAPPRPPHEVAYEALDRLERSRMLETGEVKRFFIEASEIVRTYVHGRYGIDALDMTSFDIVDALEREPVDAAVVERFRRFFDRSDLVKFAKHRPDPTECRDIVPLARGLVDDTRESLAPVPVPETTADDTVPPVAATGGAGG